MFHFSLLKESENFHNEIIRRFEVEELICTESRDLIRLSKVKFNYSNPSDFVVYLKKLTMQKLWIQDSSAIWNGNRYSRFSETLTRLGIGFTFNMIESENLLKLSSASHDFVYEPDDISTARPVKSSVGTKNGFEINFKQNQHRNESKRICRKNSFVLHPPNVLPSSFESNEFTSFYENEVVEVLITPKIIETDEDLRKLSADHRQCYFDDERKLRFFKSYTQKNCEVECLSNVTHENAKCVPFYFIRDETMEVCDHTVKEIAASFKLRRYFVSCNCLPLCNLITYEISSLMSRTTLDSNDE